MNENKLSSYDKELIEQLKEKIIDLPERQRFWIVESMINSVNTMAEMHDNEMFPESVLKTALNAYLRKQK